MGEVHLAKLPGELGFEKLLVIKTIRAELAADPRFVELFASEAKTAVALSHPNITPIYELGRADDGTLYTAMGWVDGPSLAQLGDRLRHEGRRLALPAVLFIARELLDGLAHAHSRDHGRAPVVHRDISPRNVLVDRSGRVQIVDFGIARPAESEVRGMMGSAGYMAPEQARGDVVDPRADVFSVGCVLYELLTNVRAFPREGVWMSPDLAALPDELRRVLARALALDPDERFADAQAFLRSLAPALSEHAPAFSSRDLAVILRELFPDGWGREDASASSGQATPTTKRGSRPEGEHAGGSTQAFATRRVLLETPVSPRASEVGSVTPSERTPSELDEHSPTIEEDHGVDDEHTRTEEVGLARPVERRPSRLVGPLIWALGGASLAVVVGLASLGIIGGQRAEQGEPASALERRADRDETPPSNPSERPLDRSSDEDPGSVSSNPEVESSPAADKAAHEVELVVVPAQTEVKVDGIVLTGPPYRVVLGDTPRTLELQLAGHHPLSAQLEADGTRERRFELEPLGEGRLTVLAPSVAWAEVRLDGATLGTTPLTDKLVVEGRHKLEVRCTAEVCGEDRVLVRKSISIRPGRTSKIQAEPFGPSGPND